MSDQAQTHLDHRKVLEELWCELLFISNNGLQISQYCPIEKITLFQQRYNVAESGRFLQLGSMGKLFICCRIRLKFHLRVCLKR